MHQTFIRILRPFTLKGLTDNSFFNTILHEVATLRFTLSLLLSVRNTVRTRTDFVTFVPTHSRRLYCPVKPPNSIHTDVVMDKDMCETRTSMHAHYKIGTLKMLYHEEVTLLIFQTTTLFLPLLNTVSRWSSLSAHCPGVTVLEHRAPTGLWV